MGRRGFSTCPAANSAAAGFLRRGGRGEGLQGRGTAGSGRGVEARCDKASGPVRLYSGSKVIWAVEGRSEHHEHQVNSWERKSTK